MRKGEVKSGGTTRGKLPQSKLCCVILNNILLIYKKTMVN